MFCSHQLPSVGHDLGETHSCCVDSLPSVPLRQRGSETARIQGSPRFICHLVQVEQECAWIPEPLVSLPCILRPVAVHLTSLEMGYRHGCTPRLLWPSPAFYRSRHSQPASHFQENWESGIHCLEFHPLQ